jgi:hypothetical protein
MTDDDHLRQDRRETDGHRATHAPRPAAHLVSTADRVGLDAAAASWGCWLLLELADGALAIR